MSEKSAAGPPSGAAEARDEALRREYWRADMMAFAKRRQARDRRARRMREKVRCPECGHRRASEFGGHAADCAQMFFPARFIPKIKHPGEFLAGSFVMIDPGIELQFTPIVRLLVADTALASNDDPNADRRRRIPVLMISTQTIVTATNQMALAVVAVEGRSRSAVAKLASILRYAFLQMRALHYFLLTLTVWDDLEQRTATELRDLARRIVESVAQWLDLRVKPVNRWRVAG